MANNPGLYSGYNSGFGALQDAIGMFFNLRQQRTQNERANRRDAMDEERLGLDQAAARRADAAEGRVETTARQKFLGDLADNYGGQRVDKATGQQFRDAGMGVALEPEMTLPSTQRNGIGSLGGDTGTSFPEGVAAPGADPFHSSFSAPEATGEDIIRPTASEKYRIAMQNSAAANDRLAATLQNRSQIATSQIAGAQRRAELQAEIGRARLALTRYGIDVSSHDRENALLNNMEQFAAILPQKEYQEFLNGLKANPLGFLQFLPGQGGGAFPPGPKLNYWTPPVTPGAGPPSPGGRSRFEEVK